MKRTRQMDEDEDEANFPILEDEPKFRSNAALVDAPVVAVNPFAAWPTSAASAINVSSPFASSSSSSSSSSSASNALFSNFNSSKSKFAVRRAYGFVIEFSGNQIRQHAINANVGLVRIGAYEFNFEVEEKQTTAKNNDKDHQKADSQSLKEEKKEKDSEASGTSGTAAAALSTEVQDVSANGKDDSKHDKNANDESKSADASAGGGAGSGGADGQADVEAAALILTSFGEDRWSAAKAELQHQNKLLDQLRSALKNSEREFVQVCENDESADLSRIGAMVLEQKRLAAEIKKVQSQTSIQYTAAQRVKSYRLIPSQVAAIEDVCVMWAPSLEPFRDEHTKERQTLSVAINSIGKDLHFVELPVDHPLKISAAKFYWDRATIHGLMLLTDSNGDVKADAKLMQKAVHNSNNVTQICVSALPALSTTAASRWAVRITRGSGFPSTGYPESQYWIAVGLQNKSRAMSHASYTEAGTIAFGFPTHGGMYPSSHGCSVMKTAAFMSKQLRNGDVLHFRFDPVALKLVVALNDERDEAVLSPPNAGPYWIHAAMFYAGDGVELLPQ